MGMAGQEPALWFLWKGVWMIPDDLPCSLFPGAVPAAAREFRKCFQKVVAGKIKVISLLMVGYYNI